VKLQEGVRGDQPTLDAILKILSKIAVATSFCLFLATAAFSDSPIRVSASSLDFEHRVLASRLNSWHRKSKRRPIADEPRQTLGDKGLLQSAANLNRAAPGQAR